MTLDRALMRRPMESKTKKGREPTRGGVSRVSGERPPPGESCASPPAPPRVPKRKQTDARRAAAQTKSAVLNQRLQSPLAEDAARLDPPLRRTPTLKTFRRYEP